MHVHNLARLFCIDFVVHNLARLFCIDFFVHNLARLACIDFVKQLVNLFFLVGGSSSDFFVASLTKHQPIIRIVIF